jgi:hypothetical protein
VSEESVFPPKEQGRVICPWCGSAFAPEKKRGNHERRFCADVCRNRFHSAARRWVTRAMDAGLLTVEAVKKGSQLPCAAPRRVKLVIGVPKDAGAKV